MSFIRGFGFVFTAGGVPRHWYIDAQGVKRWASTDKPVEAGGQLPPEEIEHDCLRYVEASIELEANGGR